MSQADPTKLPMAENVPLITPQPKPWDRYKERPEGPSPPPISVELALDTSVYSFTRSIDVPSLSITMTSHFMHPITICTYGSIMEDHPGYIFNRILSVTNISTGLHIRFSTSTRCRARPVRPHHSDRSFYLTLPPGVPVTRTHRLNRVASWIERDPQRNSVIQYRDGTKSHRHFEPGHEYTIGLAYRPIYESPTKPPIPGSDQLSFWWKYGAREDILIPQGATANDDGLWDLSEPGIFIGGIPDITLKIEE